MKMYCRNRVAALTLAISIALSSSVFSMPKGAHLVQGNVQGITDAEGGNNRPTLKPSEKTTYLIGPGAPVPPPPPQEDRPKDPNEPDRYLTNWVPEDVTKAPVNTPVAFAADLDDDEETMPVRKNVDGSVTVVRAFPVMN